MADIKIMVDSSADLTKEMREEYGIGLIPLLSLFGEKSYVIEEELSNDKFYDMLNNSGILPKTSQTPYAHMHKILLEESKAHDTVIYLTLSSKASGQNHSAHLVREDIIENDNPDADIIIVDSLSFSCLIGMTAIEAAKLAKEGKSADEIVSFCKEYVNSWHPLMLVSDLTFLEKGGRLRKTSAILGSLLDIKPVLTVNDGLIEAETKLRGKKKLCKKLCELAEEHEEFDSSSTEFIIAHSDIDAAMELKEEMENTFDTSGGITIFEFGPLVGTNTGNGAFAIVFKRK